mmetsp:Transcript_12485/g.52525  ORF Transcript_12485/g.52525 Transcript_12485/m.52525 type:complete len:202 (-) Transcript_12485:896-1501(-)
MATCASTTSTPIISRLTRGSVCPSCARCTRKRSWPRRRRGNRAHIRARGRGGGAKRSRRADGAAEAPFGGRVADSNTASALASHILFIGSARSRSCFSRYHLLRMQTSRTPRCPARILRPRRSRRRRTHCRRPRRRDRRRLTGHRSAWQPPCARGRRPRRPSRYLPPPGSHCQDGSLRLNRPSRIPSCTPPPTPPPAAVRE